MAKKKRLVIIDGMAYLFRSFYALPPDMINSEGVCLNAVFGFIKALQRAEKKFSPDYAVVAYDSPGPTFREKIHADYKANRDEPPEALVPQFPLVEKVVPLFGWHLLRKPGFEADDIMGTLVRMAQKDKLETIIMTGDKDLLQLIAPDVQVYREGRMGGKMYGAEETIERFGVKPEQITDLLGLMGDASDNIPGVPGVGEKTAAKLLQEYGTLEKVLKAAKQIKKPKLSSNLQEYADQARLSKRLAMLDEKMVLGKKMSELQLKDPDWAPLIKQLEWFEFKGTLADIKSRAPKELLPKAAPVIEDKTRKIKKQKLEVAANSKAFKEALGNLEINIAKPAGVIAWPEKKPNRLAVWQENRAVVLEADEDAVSACVNLLKSAFIYGSKPLQILLMKTGKALLKNIFDVEVGAFLLNSSKSGRNLQGAASLFGLKDEELPPLDDDLIGPAPLAMAAHARLALLAGEKIKAALKPDKLSKLYDELEGPLIPVLAQMELEGIKVDASILKEIDVEIQKTLKKLEKKAFKLAGKEFNLNSPLQLAAILFDELGLTPGKKTKTGFSTNEETLENLSDEHELPAVILENRGLAKLSSTYLQALPKLIDLEDKRVHTHWNQTIAATGRLSSKDPNLQNIPIRTELGRSTRKAFVPDKESDFIFAADYSQIELRVLAHFSKDKILKEAFEKDMDIHTRTAAQVFGVQPEKIDFEMRRRSKIINFGILYGMGPFRLGKDLGIPLKEAKAFIESYFNGFPQIKDYLESVKAEAEAQGYVTTIWGRRRYIPEISSGNRIQREAGLRAALNLPIQGSAADLIKAAMLQVRVMLDKKRARSRMLLQVHDELVFEMAKEEASWLPAQVEKIMTHAMDLDVPLKVSMAQGRNWYEAKG